MICQILQSLTLTKLFYIYEVISNKGSRLYGVTWGCGGRFSSLSEHSRADLAHWVFLLSNQQPPPIVCMNLIISIANGERLKPVWKRISSIAQTKHSLHMYNWFNIQDRGRTGFHESWQY